MIFERITYLLHNYNIYSHKSYSRFKQSILIEFFFFLYKIIIILIFLLFEIIAKKKKLENASYRIGGYYCLFVNLFILLLFKQKMRRKTSKVSLLRSLYIFNYIKLKAIFLELFKKEVLNLFDINYF